MVTLKDTDMPQSVLANFGTIPDGLTYEDSLSLSQDESINSSTASLDSAVQRDQINEMSRIPDSQAQAAVLEEPEHFETASYGNPIKRFFEAYKKFLKPPEDPNEDKFDPEIYGFYESHDSGEIEHRKIPVHEKPYGSKGCRWKPYEAIVPKRFHWILERAKGMTLLVDNHNKTRSLGIANELAEAYDHKVFKAYLSPIRNIAYYGLWGVTYGYLGLRNFLHGLNEHSTTEMLKNLFHDWLATVFLSVKIVHWVGDKLNWLGTKVGLNKEGNEENPGVLQVIFDFVAPYLSFYSAELALHWFLDDTIGAGLRVISPFTFDLVKPLIDKLGNTACKEFFQRVFGSGDDHEDFHVEGVDPESLYALN